MYEQSKAAKRRMTQPAFMTRYFTGSGLDIGAGPDGLSRYCGVFPLLHAVRDWDLADGDAQYLAGVADASVDFVHASHCLEHMRDPRVALSHWLRVVRPGGHVIVTVPDEDMYEAGVWPSRRNSDHKWTFTASKRESWSPVSVSLLDLAQEFAGDAELERLDVLREFYRPGVDGDQTLGPVAECAIEMVLRRTAPSGEPGPAARSLIPPLGRMRLKACKRGLLLFDPADKEGALLDRYGEYADATATALAAMLRPGDVALSYGAGLGTLAVAMARRAGTVFAVADAADRLHLLAAQVALNELDGLHPLAPPVAPDSLGLETCRLLHVGSAADAVAVLGGAADVLRRCQPLLCLSADTPQRAASALALRPEGYAAFWHVAPLAGTPSWFGPPGPPDVAAMLVMAPPHVTLNGLTPARTPDWRADHAA